MDSRLQTEWEILLEIWWKEEVDIEIYSSGRGGCHLISSDSRYFQLPQSKDYIWNIVRHKPNLAATALSNQQTHHKAKNGKICFYPQRQRDHIMTCLKIKSSSKTNPALSRFNKNQIERKTLKWAPSSDAASRGLYLSPLGQMQHLIFHSP